MEQYIASIISIFAIVISFMAYRNSEQKLRLDLFEARWEIYKEILKFCSIVSKNGGIPKPNQGEINPEIIGAVNSAHKSFRGHGYHRSKALFGDDVNERLDALDKIYSELYAESKVIDYDGLKNDDQKMENVKKVIEFYKELPEIFKPYVYFGDIKAKDLN
jgi:hypothetical protein